jgi:hypothetical protein
LLIPVSGIGPVEWLLMIPQLAAVLPLKLEEVELSLEDKLLLPPNLLWNGGRKKIRKTNAKEFAMRTPSCEMIKKIYALILGQCAEKMKQKLSAYGDWIAVSTAEDPVRLLGLINQVCMTPGA